MCSSSVDRRGRNAPSGFTLIEVVVVIVLLGILAAVAAQNSGHPSELSLPSQAETMASNIRYLQNVAATGSRTRLTVTGGTNGTYLGERCTAVDPSLNCTAWATVMNVTVDKKVVLGGAPASIQFDTLGQPTAAASYTLFFGGSTKTVGVAAVTGYVAITSS